MTQEDIIKLFEESDALLTGHFKLTSGRHSDVYYEKFMVLKQPAICTKICEEMASRLAGLRPETIVGPTTGGIIIAYDVARYLGIEAVYAEREGGKRVFKRGFSLRPKQKVVIVDDVLTIGTSILEVIGLVQSFRADIVSIGEIIDRSNGMAKFDYPYFALATVKANNWDPQQCPLCAAGQPFTQRGSRKF